MKSKKILLTGVNGQVGHVLQTTLAGLNVVGMSRDELDLSDVEAIRSVVREVKPDLIINPAAYTAVDKAESEPDLAYAVNAVAPQVLAEEAERIGSALIHFSTDYVYDGNKATAYIESDAVNPNSVYGKSKLAGEEAIQRVGLPHLILRTSWVYGAYGKNFLKTILRLAAERDTLGIVSDQFGAPTSSTSIAFALKALLTQWDPTQNSASGVYHFTNADSTSWHGFASEIVSQYQSLAKQPALKVNTTDIAKLTTADYPTPAARPKNSCLDNGKLKQTFDIALPTWQQGLQEVMSRL
ncbi:MAG: dTDP-4-dehydrorhamnose reductase [Methylophilaceae bacterium]